MKFILFLIIILSVELLPQKMRSQTSSIQIKDLTCIKNESSSTENNSLKDLSFYFKVSDLSQSDSLVILVGTTAESSNLQIAQGNFIHNGTAHQLNFNGSVKNLRDYEASFNLGLPETWFQAPLYLSVFIIDQSGNSTFKRTIKLN